MTPTEKDIQIESMFSTPAAPVSRQGQDKERQRPEDEELEKKVQIVAALTC